MSSFLCFICHSTVNRDTNEDTRDKYREVIGIMLCPDSHLCFICCHVLRKLCLFKSICLKRSLEYPVLFSEKGTLNLQRSDTELNVLCNEDMCTQQQLRKFNFKSYMYNNFSAYDYLQENSQSNQYVELEEERHDFVDYICQASVNKNYFFDNVLEQNRNYSEDNGILYDDISERIQDISHSYTTYEPYERNDWIVHNEMRKIQTDCEYSLYNIGNVEYNPSCQINNVKTVEPLLPKCNDSFATIEPSPKMQDLEMVIQKNVVTKNVENDLEKSNNCDINQNLESKEVQTDLKAASEANIVENEDSSHCSENENQDDKLSEVANDDLDPKPEKKEIEDTNKKLKKKKKRKFPSLTIEEQKAELDARRKEKKYIEAEFKCHNCALGFLYKDSYQTHMMRHEESNGEHRCEICTLRFASRRLLRIHAVVHERTPREPPPPPSPAACHHCGRVFMNPNRLRQHVKRSHLSRITNKSYPCSVCGKTYNNQAAVRTHMIKHIKGSFKCETCSSVYSSPYTLNQHKKKHLQTHHAPAHYCTLCDVSFVTRKSLLAHQRNTSKHQETVYECPVCKRTCATLASLSSHMQVVHASEKSHACAHCAAAYTSKRSLLRHAREAHSGRAKPPESCVCHLCGNSFKGNSKLTRHLKNVCKKVTEDNFPDVYNQGRL